MTNKSPADYQEAARRTIDDGTHYLAAVADLAERQPVDSIEDIVAANGTKLIPKGTRVDGSLRERLMRHKLIKPLDRCLVAGQSVTATDLATEAARQAREYSWLNRLAHRSGDPLAVQHGLARLVLPAEVLFNLTVAREQQPRLFQHLVTVAAVAHYLALRLSLPERETAIVLTAALLHDLGELHTDPGLLHPEHTIEGEERRYVDVHPITGYLIASEIPGLPPAVATAVLQHQERLDGSGYPHGLRDAAVGRTARIVGIADVCASILARHADGERLRTLLRLNRRKYDAHLLDLLQEGLGGVDGADSYVAADDMPRLERVAAMLVAWDAVRAALAPGNTTPPETLAFLFERMSGLRNMLVQFGFDPQHPDQLVALARSDTHIAAELSAALAEMHWQFADLLREIERHHRNQSTGLPADANAQLEDWLANLRAHLAN